MRPQAQGRRQRGAAAVELALTLPVLLMLLAYIMFYGRVLYNYEVAQKAARDAVRYLSSAAAVNMRSTAQAANEVAVAQAIANAELAGLNPGPGNGPFVFIRCDGLPCLGLALPNLVRVDIQIVVQNDIFGYYVPYLGSSLLQAGSTMRYVGN
ncbi:TadE/TadG family type IV pilus assembly protein [Duganella sp. CT11-25]|uniref:TadE/TadG family type IV pilus assembly protein n=1 Tax=unclassified Duganella TaxID=2636909 RepID=UPI0039AEA18C